MKFEVLDQQDTLKGVKLEVLDQQDPFHGFEFEGLDQENPGQGGECKDVLGDLVSHTLSVTPNFVEQAITARKRKRGEGEEKEKFFSFLNQKEKILKSENGDIGVKVNIVARSGGGGVKEVEGRGRRYREEALLLACEWRGCGGRHRQPEEFHRHVAQHCRQAEVRPLPPPLHPSLLCLWTSCTFETSVAEEMVRHINFHAFHTKIKEQGRVALEVPGLVCGLGVEGRSQLPSLSTPWECRWQGCREEGWTAPHHFYHHVLEHSLPATPPSSPSSSPSSSTLPCLWLGCTAIFGMPSKLREHLRSHSQEKMAACPTCGAMFANRSKLLDHVRRQGGASDLPPCDTCGKTFATPRLLRDHMRSHVSQYLCPQCDMTCTTPSTLATHIRYRHTTDRPLSCQLCQYKGKTTADMNSHMKIHYTAVEVRCKEEGCDFSCRAAKTLVKHMAQEHGGAQPELRYCCHLCDARVAQGSQLSRYAATLHSTFSMFVAIQAPPAGT